MPFQTMRCSKTLLADIALENGFFSFCVCIRTRGLSNNHRMTNKALSQHTSHIFIRSLVRVNAHASDQTGWSIKHLLAHIALALLRSLPLRSFLSIKVSFLLFVSDDDDSFTSRSSSSSSGGIFKREHQLWFFFLACLQNRPRVHRSFRTWIYLSSSTRVASFFFQSLAERREVLSFSLVFSTRRESSVLRVGKKKLRRFLKKRLARIETF